MKFLNIIDNIEEITVAICLSVMTMLTFANVIARYVFSASFSFSEEITTYLFVLLSLLGTSIAAKRKAHLGLTILTDRMSPDMARKSSILGFLLGVVFSAMILYYGVEMVISQRALGQLTAGMQWPEWIFGSFVPVGAAFVCFRFVELFIESLKHPAGEEH